MELESIRSLTRISRSLWGDFNRSVSISEDTLTRISLLQLSEEKTIEKTTRAMIERAERNPPKLLTLHHPFYRMAPMERFLLTALHVEKWPYDRICRVMNLDPKLLEPWAWATRIKFAFQELNADLTYPRGPAHLGMNCPEYDASAPWTGRLLDDELERRDRVFLQNHLMACTDCRKSLELTRKFFFKIEASIPVKDAYQETENAVAQIYQNWKLGESAFRPIKTTFSESLTRFLGQSSVQWTLAFLCVFTFYFIKRGLK